MLRLMVSVMCVIWLGCDGGSDGAPPPPSDATTPIGDAGVTPPGGDGVSPPSPKPRVMCEECAKDSECALGLLCDSSAYVCKTPQTMGLIACDTVCHLACKDVGGYTA